MHLEGVVCFARRARQGLWASALMTVLWLAAPCGTASAADPSDCIANPTAACIAALIQLPPPGPDAPNWEPLAGNLAAAGRLEAARDAALPLANAVGRGEWAAQTLAWRTVAAEAKARPGAVASFAPIEHLASDPNSLRGRVQVTAAYSMLFRDLTGRNPAVIGSGPAWLAAAEARRIRGDRNGFPTTLPAMLDAWEQAIGLLSPQWQGSRWAEFASALVWLGQDDAARAALRAAENAHRIPGNNNRDVSVPDVMRTWLRLGESLLAFEAALYSRNIDLPDRYIAGRLAEVAEGALAADQPDVARAAAKEAHRHARDLREGKPWIEPSVLYRLIRTQAAAGDEASARAMAEDWLRWARATGLRRSSNLATAAAAFDALDETERTLALLREALETGTVQRRDPTGRGLQGWAAEGPILSGGHAAELAAIGLLSIGKTAVAGGILGGLDRRIRDRAVKPVFVSRLVNCGDGASPLAEQAAGVAAATRWEGGPTRLLLAATAECLRRGAEPVAARGLAAAHAALEADPNAWAEWRFALARLAALQGRQDLVRAILSRSTAEALALEHPGRRADALGIAAAHAAALLN